MKNQNNKMPAFGRDEWLKFQAQVFDEMKALTLKKNQDYTGGKDADSPFANFDEASSFGVDPLIGLCIRMGDKFQRLKSFAKTGCLALNTPGDSVEDIFRDLIGYSCLALGMLERKKRLHCK